MLHYLFDIIDNIVFGFTHNLSIAGLINTYWFLFFIEFPRYYLLELIITIYYKLTYKRRRRRQQRFERHIVKPLKTRRLPPTPNGRSKWSVADRLYVFLNFAQGGGGRRGVMIGVARFFVRLIKGEKNGKNRKSFMKSLKKGRLDGRSLD